MNRTNALNSAIQAALKLRGGALTRRARILTMNTLIETLYHEGFQIPDIRALRGKHIAAYVQARLEVVSPRTVANELAHIRGALKAVGRDEFAAHPSIENAALGIPKTSRKGTSKAISPEAVERVLEEARKSRAEVLATVRLQHCFGLRAQEAVLSASSLPMWETQLLMGQPIHIIKGTKGGRPRYTTPVNRAEAISAVRFAVEVAASHRNGELFPHSTAKKACKSYANVWSRLKRASREGVTSRSFRYAYAQAREQQCLQAGLSLRDTRAVVALDLGHGDGRGRYVAMVYGMRPAIGSKDVWTSPAWDTAAGQQTAASPASCSTSAEHETGDEMLVSTLPIHLGIDERNVGDAQVVLIKCKKHKS